jgi:hypothetical protein
MIWGQVEMELAIICASAPAMKGFFSAVHKRVATAYGSRKYGYGYRSRVTSGNKAPGESGVSDGTAGAYDGVQMDSRWTDQHSSRWTEKSDPFTTRASNDELLNVPEKKMTLRGGILVTETYSVDRYSDFGRNRPMPPPPERL